MPRRLWIAALCFWPGLAQIWSGQEVLGIFLSLFFAASLNAFLVTRFLWTELFPPGWDGLFAALAVGCWISGFLYTIWWVWRCHPERYRHEIDRLFREATESYLQGRWNDSRRRLERILALDDTDADALMQLGTLYVKCGQSSAARRAFRQCLELELGSKWRWEIGQALKRLGDG